MLSDSCDGTHDGTPRVDKRRPCFRTSTGHPPLAISQAQHSAQPMIFHERAAKLRRLHVV